MTAEEILKNRQQSDRVLIAQAVMGWVYKSQFYPLGDPTNLATLMDDVPSQKLWRVGLNAWNPFGSIHDALTVMNELRKMGCYLSITATPDGWDVTFPRRENLVQANAYRRELPDAIASAVIRLIEKNKLSKLWRTKLT